MKAAFCADVHMANHKAFAGETHAGLNRRARLCTDALTRAVSAARDAGCGLFVILGDLFDSVKPEPQVIEAAQRALGDMPTLLLLGNHEMVSGEAGDNALGPMRPVATVIDTPQVCRFGDLEIVAIPYMAGDASETLPQVLAQVQGSEGARGHGRPASPVRVLALHLGLSDGQTAAYLRGAPDSVPIDLVKRLYTQHDFDLVIAGHWHEARSWKSHALIQQAGALVPTGFDCPGIDYGQLWVLDTDAPGELGCITISGPRFFKVAWPDKLPACSEGTPFYRVTAAPEDFAAAQDVLKSLDAIGEIVPDDTEAHAAARTSATVARSADTLDEALAGFVGQMPLVDGVDRQDVLQRCRQYLARLSAMRAVTRMGGEPSDAG